MNILCHSAPLLLVAFAALSQAADAPATASIRPVTGSIHRWVSLPSTLAPWQQAALHAKVTGYLKSVRVDKGTVVKSGEVLAVIEVPELEADLAKNQAETTAATIETERLHAARKKSAGLILPQSIDNAEARLAMAKANLARTETLLKFAEIRAPFDGIITARMVDPGALVTASISQVFQIVDSSTIRLQIPVTEMETSLVLPGKPIKSTIEAHAPTPVEGTISRTAHALDPATRTMLAEADLPNPSLQLRPGMYAMTRIGVEKHDNATLIPVTGLVMEKTNPFVFKFVGGKAVKTPVTLGFNDGVNAEIPSLKPDDIILLPGPKTLTDGQPVTLAKP